MNIIKKIVLNAQVNKQYVYWYRYEKSRYQNFGDIIGPVLLKKFSGITSIHVEDRISWMSHRCSSHYLTVGSIVDQGNKDSVIWGSGIVDSNIKVDIQAQYLAVRGPKTRERILSEGGLCPEIYGDPALLLPLLYPKLTKKQENITIIPHYVDYISVKNMCSSIEHVDVVKMMTNNFEKTLAEIQKSQLIISSSLHGLILAVAYGIPCIWVEFSDGIFGDDIKYYDFFASVQVENPKKYVVTDLKEFLLLCSEIPAITVDPEIILKLQKQLLASYPFEITNKNILEQL